MHPARLRWCLSVILLAAITGCAPDARLMLSGLDGQQSSVELVDVPFHPQVTDQCGPAALASILESSGVTVTPETLKSQVYIPGRNGSLQIELLAAGRAYGRMPYLIDGDVGSLIDELQGGRPVLVMQNLGSKWFPVWHYAVVVGYLPEERQLILRSGDQDRHLISARKFVRTWRKAGYWGILALRPGEMPASPVADKYVRSVAALETSGDIEDALAGYRAATERWPEYAVAWLGLGNALYARGDLDAAGVAYKRVLSLESDHLIALHNLSQVQVDQGCPGNAHTTLSAALSAARPGTAIYRILEASRREIESQESSASCL